MKTLQIFDPAMCCNTGVCGVDADQQLVSFAADIDWAKKQGAQIERFNLAQQPMAFAENAVVKSFLERSGQEGLPLILLDGEIALTNRYPRRAELARWLGLSILPVIGSTGTNTNTSANSAASAPCCGEGQSC
ncbi:arsenite efflux transporter metallochaperone ArsD [Undibacterium amnicola]|uniref:Arsenite efflux transporter metallochaperone ArsD n=1 Tax=Undibacterium amnicola TaxID=1834038 RepID=A0ABR6XQ20_9BURK|nr:arsenite efflux transporter metallochaperone ArsD [Undibacterium amnicola]MBC3831546.1 arsenite efflux transporter metallochaperone ArsD [Undibacterium amnicola]